MRVSQTRLVMNCCLDCCLNCCLDCCLIVAWLLPGNAPATAHLAQSALPRPLAQPKFTVNEHVQNQLLGSCGPRSATQRFATTGAYVRHAHRTRQQRAPEASSVYLATRKPQAHCNWKLNALPEAPHHIESAEACLAIVAGDPLAHRFQSGPQTT